MVRRLSAAQHTNTQSRSNALKPSHVCHREFVLHTRCLCWQCRFFVVVLLQNSNVYVRSCASMFCVSRRICTSAFYAARHFLERRTTRVLTNRAVPCRCCRCCCCGFTIMPHREPWRPASERARALLSARPVPVAKSPFIWDSLRSPGLCSENIVYTARELSTRFNASTVYTDIVVRTTLLVYNII